MKPNPLSDKTILKNTQKELAEANQRLNDEISANAKTTRELAKKDEEIQSILDNSPVGIMLVDQQTRKISYINHKTESLSGYSKSDLFESVCNEVICPAEVDRCPILDLGENIDHSERILKSSNGQEIPILKSASYVSYQGRPHILEQFIDIRDQKAALVKTEESERRYRHLFENLCDAAFLADQKTGMIIDANAQAQILMGKTRNEIVGMHQKELHPLENMDKYTTGFKNHLKKGPLADYEGEIVRKDGSHVPVKIHASPFQTNGDRLVLGIFKDLSQEKKLNDKARENENRFRLAFENSNEGMCLVDAKGNLMRTNKRMCEMFGYSKQELETLTVNDIAHPEDKEMSPKVIRNSLAGHATNTKFEKRYIHKKGHTITAKVSTALVRNEEHKPLYFISHINDITEEKNREKGRRKYEKQLRQSQKLEAIGTLAGGIAHDFNNILSSVIGFAELAIDDADEGSVMHDNLSEILTAGIRAKDLIKQILMFSRKEEIEKKPIKLKSIVEETSRLLRASIPTTIEFSINADSESVVMGDPSQFHQILMNLCTNASHAMQKTGGNLNVELKDVTLDPAFVAVYPGLSSGPHVLLTIEDTGTGIPEHVRDKIFDPFFTTKQKGEGTGLGLSVVHGIVRDCMGGIFVYSEEGKGTIFKVYFPVVKTSIQPVHAAPVVIPNGSEHILLVDDEPALVKMGKQALECLGYRVTTRTSSIEALELFKVKNESFDLVITDMTMPKMDGEDLVINLKKINSKLPVILCTGFNPNMDEKRGREIGIDAFANKPFLKNELGQTVRRVLDRRTLADYR